TDTSSRMAWMISSAVLWLGDLRTASSLFFPPNFPLRLSASVIPSVYVTRTSSISSWNVLDGKRESAAIPMGMPTEFRWNNLEDPFDVRTTIGGLWPAFTYFNTRVAGSYSA